MENFSFVKELSTDLYELLVCAEKLLYVDPVASIVRQGTISEQIVNRIIVDAFPNADRNLTLYDKINLLCTAGYISAELKKRLDSLRSMRNAAAHESIGDEFDAICAMNNLHAFIAWFYSEHKRQIEHVPGFVVPQKDDSNIYSKNDIDELGKRFDAIEERLDNALNLYPDIMNVKTKSIRQQVRMYKFGDVEYVDPRSLVIALCNDLNKAMEHFKAGFLSRYFSEVDEESAVEIVLLEKKGDCNQAELFAVLLNMIPEQDGIFYANHHWDSYDHLGHNGIKAIHEKKPDAVKFYNEMHLSGVLDVIYTKKQETKARYRAYSSMSINEILYSLCSKKILYYNGLKFQSLESLAGYLNRIHFLNAEWYLEELDDLCKSELFDAWLMPYYNPKIDRHVIIEGRLCQINKSRSKQFKEEFLNKEISAVHKFMYRDEFFAEALNEETLLCPLHYTYLIPTEVKFYKAYVRRDKCPSIYLFFCKECQKMYFTPKQEKANSEVLKRRDLH